MTPPFAAAPLPSDPANSADPANPSTPPTEGWVAWRGWRAVALVLTLSLALTGAVWNMLFRQADRLAQEQFQAAGDLIRDRLVASLRGCEHALRGEVALLDANGQVDRRTWRIFLDKLRPTEDCPGLQGIGFAPRVGPAALAAHVAGVRAEGFSAYDVAPPGKRPDYFPVLLVEPASGRNLRSFGLDLYAEPTLQAAMDGARDSGTARLSAASPLRAAEGAEGPASIAMLVPVYETPRLPFDPELRRRALNGFVFAGLHLGQALQAAQTGPSAVQLDTAVYTGSQLLYASMPAALTKKARYRRSIGLDVYGVPWTLVLTTNSVFDAKVVAPLRSVAWLASLAVIGLLVVIAVLLVVHRTGWRGPAQ